MIRKSKLFPLQTQEGSVMDAAKRMACVVIGAPKR
jgi:hypothetical protein